MILIFGGTTEGRLAASTLDEAGTPFFYSTKGTTQSVELRNGVRLSGAMSLDEIKTFCHSQDIRLIVNASHPYAENLHATIAQVGLPVVRLQRSISPRLSRVHYYNNYIEAISALESMSIKRLLALSGANTISKLKPWWQSHDTFFRILDRDESRTLASKEEFPEQNLLFYNESNTIPSKESEKEMMCTLACDAIITKDSGDTGGFTQKVEAALELGIQVLAIERPQLPQTWTYVDGAFSLRRAVEHLLPSFFPLKTGLTTGACATAAVKAALHTLLLDEYPEEITFAIANGEHVSIPVTCESRGVASVVKDFSDDPDVTKGCRIRAHVVQNDHHRFPSIRFFGGEGVGTVTLPGLGLPIGDPAINLTPRKMIEAEIRSMSSAGFDVTLSVENGAELAKRTFNNRVGVVGGLSIIGTSGIVRPLSNEAFSQSITRELEVAAAIGCDTIGLVSGMKSELFLQSRFPRLRCIHYGNFIGHSLEAARRLGIKNVILGIMIGKAVKLAEGNLDTHSHKVTMNKAFLVQLAKDACCSQSAISAINDITLANELWTSLSPSDSTLFINALKSHCLDTCSSVFPHSNLTILFCH